MRAGWRKSSYSDAHGNECVEIASLADGIGVRDSKQPGQGHILLRRARLAAVLSDIKAAKYDL
ncbi:DUF397 domain-containing protein [Actinomadura hibisca]|uniref:DUF397 domain-containing protein n=1 Tax=Actinomadura hibisca TaxID=68565 RepID=UPI000ABD3A1C|nr:DUF397 domain-containing protein [Actinomadura hibisca]